MKSKTIKTNYISYNKTLIRYEGVQLFAATGNRKRWYICLAVPSPEGDEWFLCTPVSEGDFLDYLYEAIDLYALIKSSSNGKHYIISFSEEKDNKFPLHELKSIPEHWLPDRHIFANSHTEEFSIEERQTVPLDVKDSDIHIDGRWDAQDLSALPDLFSDNYSFLYSLTSNEYIRNSTTQAMFRKFPWRGGFSTVGFYRGLYNQVPRTHRLEIKGISYHSPGEITISAVDVIVDQMRECVKIFNTQKIDLQKQYKELYDGMSLRNLLGRSTDEINPDKIALEFVETYTQELATKMGFKMIDQLVSLTDGNWIESAKMLMSFYRRLRALSDFFDSGKASF